MTELDIDPLTTIPNINFKPNETEYVAVRQWAKPSFDALTQEVVKAPSALVDGVWTQQWEVVDKYRDFTAADGVVVTKVEQEAAIVASDKVTKAKAAAELSKLTGILILGVLCSATKEDQNGLTAIAMGVTLARMSSTTFPDTVFQFSNGNTLTITDSNFNSIYAAWVPFRQSFFATS